MLAGPLAAEGVQPVTWRNCQIIQNRSRVQLSKLAQDSFKDLRRKPT